MKTVNCSHCGGTGLVIDQKALGEELRELRLNAGLKIRQVSSRMNLSVCYISELELGRRFWDDEKIDAYRSICNDYMKRNNIKTKSTK